MQSAENRNTAICRGSRIPGRSSRQHQGGPPAVTVKGRSGSLGGGVSCRSLRAKHGRRNAASAWEKKSQPETGGDSGWQLARGDNRGEQPRGRNGDEGGSFGCLPKKPMNFTRFVSVSKNAQQPKNRPARRPSILHMGNARSVDGEVSSQPPLIPTKAFTQFSNVDWSAHAL